MCWGMLTQLGAFEAMLPESWSYVGAMVSNFRGMLAELGAMLALEDIKVEVRENIVNYKGNTVFEGVGTSFWG